MATRNGVGEINDLVKLLDEYQLQVPKKYLQEWSFNTLEETEKFVSGWEAKGRVFEGHEWKKPVKDENGDKLKDAHGNTIYEGIFGEDGKIHIKYCPVGEMVVKCVERAAKIMGSPVHITGAYLTGRNWAECH